MDFLLSLVRCSSFSTAVALCVSECVCPSFSLVLFRSFMGSFHASNSPSCPIKTNGNTPLINYVIIFINKILISLRSGVQCFKLLSGIFPATHIYGKRTTYSLIRCCIHIVIPYTLPSILLDVLIFFIDPHPASYFSKLIHRSPEILIAPLMTFTYEKFD